MKLLVLDGPDVANSWDSSDSLFPNSSAPVFGRGGLNYDDSSASIFAFYVDAGSAYTHISFRPVVLSSQS